MTTLLKILAAAALDYAKNWAKKDARVRGVWAGNPPLQVPVDSIAATQAGYDANRPCQLFVDAQTNPIFWRHESGHEYRADLPIVSDGGSVPGVAQRIHKAYADLHPFGRHLYAWLFHDAAYHHRGCWWRPAPEAEWAWLTLTRKQADMLLFQQLPSTGGKNLEVRAVYAAVRRFGGKAWKRHRERERQTT